MLTLRFPVPSNPKAHTPQHALSPALTTGRGAQRPRGGGQGQVWGTRGSGVHILQSCGVQRCWRCVASREAGVPLNMTCGALSRGGL